MKNKDVVGIDVSKLTLDAYIQLAQVHKLFENNARGFKQLLKWIKRNIDCPMDELLICFEITGFWIFNFLQCSALILKILTSLPSVKLMSVINSSLIPSKGGLVT